jgi:hypothetical protein
VTSRRIVVDHVLFVVYDLHEDNVEAVWHAPEPVTDAPHRRDVP